jgi:hypothetical protein
MPQVEFVSLLANFKDAVALARLEARRTNSRAWVQKDADQYYRIPDNPDSPLLLDDSGQPK